MSFKATRSGYALPGYLKDRLPKRNDFEFQDQCALFEWARIPAVLAQMPELRLLQGSMSGVPLSAAVAGKAKAAGMLKGWPDVQLPVARGGYIGLVIELKHGDNKPSKEQKEMAKALIEAGWLHFFIWEWTEARQKIIEYLNSGKTLITKG